jgi:hypothetical protein
MRWTPNLGRGGVGDLVGLASEWLIDDGSTKGSPMQLEAHLYDECQ